MGVNWTTAANTESQGFEPAADKGAAGSEGDMAGLALALYSLLAP